MIKYMFTLCYKWLWAGRPLSPAVQRENVGVRKGWSCNRPTNGVSTEPPLSASQAKIDAWLDKDARAHAFILFNIKPSVARQFVADDAETAAELWHSVQTQYHRENSAQKIALENQLASLKITDTAQIMEQITEFVTIQKQLISLGSGATDEDFVHRLLAKLPESLSSFCDTVTLLPDTPSMLTLVGMLQDRVARRKSTQGASETLLQAKGRGKWQSKGSTSNTGNFKPNNPNHKDLLCHYCGFKGHIQPDCRKKQRDDASGKKTNHNTNRNNNNHTSSNNDNNSSQGASSKETVFIGIEELPSDVPTPTTSTLDAWVVDSGCTTHMTHDRSILHDIRPSSSTVSIGDASNLQATCVGNVRIHSSPGQPSTFRDVLYVPKLSSNLLSVFRIAEKGFGVYFDSSVREVIDTTTLQIVARGVQEGGLYRLKDFDGPLIDS